MSETSSKPAERFAPSKIGTVILPPDATLMIEARIEAGETAVKLKAITNTILQDPVLAIAIIQHANSLLFSGASVTDVEGAVSRLGVQKLASLLGDLNNKTKFDPNLIETMEALRLNCRRTSIVALIIATVVRPSVAGGARVAGLFADIGYMLALAIFGNKYLELAKTNKRKALTFRLQKDFNFDLTAMQVAYLNVKGMPKPLLLPYDSNVDTHSPADTDLRFVVQSAIEMLDAYDNKKFLNYSPDKPLPAQSALRMLKVTPVTQERIFKTCSAYLKSIEAEKPPEEENLVLAPEEEAPKADPLPPSGGDIPVPQYDNLSVKPSSRDALQGFYSLCEQEKKPEVLKQKALEFLTSKKLFNRMAVIRVTPGSEDAVMDFSFGLNQKAGEKISIRDPLSPLRAFRMQITSSNPLNKERGATAPFGTSAFAIGPLEVLPSGEKLVLYGDLHGSGILSLEARRIFRLTRGLLMQTLKEIQQLPAK